MSEISKPTGFDIVRQWNKDLPVSVDQCVHHLIEKQVAQRADAVAVCSTTESLSYQELDAYATTLAKRLIHRGVEPGSYVALSFEHSIWAVVAMLGVWKAGAAFAPLPASPLQRVETIVAQLNPTLILTSPSRFDSHKNIPQSQLVVSLDELNRDDKLGRISLDVKVEPSSLAYAIFTSGSTGTPKGAQIEHRNFNTYVGHWAAAVNIDTQSRVFNYSSYLFDVSMSDIFAPLCAGATVCVPSEDDRFNNITKSMRDLRVTHAEFVRSLLSTLSPKDVDVDTLKYLIMVGEKPTATIVDRWASIPKLHLINSYGPAECCPHSALFDMSAGNPTPGNIGRPMGSALWIVNSSDIEQPVGVGEEGELLIEGPLVGRGYINDPEKTQAAFIPTPNWLQKIRQDCYSTVYKTGDLCRYTDDGTIEYLARNDLQVKIRGQRMELGEVEYQLRRLLPSTADLAVELADVGSTQGRPKLTAFVCLKTQIVGQQDVAKNSGLSKGQENQQSLYDLIPTLERDLAAVLPSYMVPSVFIAMDYIPRLHSAKTDRKTLRAIAATYAQSPAIETSPEFLHLCSPMERKLQEVWADVFGIDVLKVGSSLNFFQLGGDSISAIRLRTEANRRGISVTMKDIFDNPVFSDLASVASWVDSFDSRDLGQFELIAPELREEVRQTAAAQCKVSPDIFEDIFPALGSACYFMLTSEVMPGGWMHCNAFPLAPEVDLDRYLDCWRCAIKTHHSLRSRIIATKTAIYQAILREEKEHFRTSTATLEEHIETEKTGKMLWGDSLSRYCVVTQPDGQRFFVWTAKHAIFDDWSLHVLYQKICNAYHSGDLTMSEIIRPSQIVKYKNSADINPAKAWFRSYFANAKPKTIFPVPQGYKYEKDIQEFWQLDLPTSPSLASSSSSTPAFTFSTVIAVAWALVLAKHTNSTDFCLGLIRSGRNIPVPGVDSYMGPLTGLMPLRVNVEESLMISEVLRKYQNDWAESSEHDFYSWIELVDQDGDQAVKGAVAGATTLNIVHPLDKADEKIQHPLFTKVDIDAGEVLEVSDISISTAPASSTPSESESSGHCTPVSSVSASSTRIKDSAPLLPPVREFHLGASQKPVNLNVFLPRQEGDLVTVMLRRDTTACTKEIADAFVRAFESVAYQLLVAREGMLIGEVEVPDTRNVRVTYFEEGV